MYVLTEVSGDPQAGGVLEEHSESEDVADDTDSLQVKSVDDYFVHVDDKDTQLEDMEESTITGSISIWLKIKILL